MISYTFSCSGIVETHEVIFVEKYKMKLLAFSYDETYTFVRQFMIIFYVCDIAHQSHDFGRREEYDLIGYKLIR